MCSQDNRDRGAATIRVRRPSGAVDTFLADTCDIESGVITATGRWKWASGRLSPPGSYSWPRGRVLQVRWAREAVTA